MIIQNTLELIGNTPVIKVRNIDTGLCDLFLKLECQNPGGSIKDRIAISMIEAAEKVNYIQETRSWRQLLETQVSGFLW